MLHFMRHAESVSNKYRTDNPDPDITLEGKIQASRVKGNYDLVILSPLKRTHQTLKSSKISFDYLFVSDLVREFKTSKSDFLQNERIVFENENDLFKRICLFEKQLKYLKNKYKKILIITHGLFIYYYMNKNINRPKLGRVVDNCEIVKVQE